MNPLIMPDHETFKIVIGACQEQLEEGNYRRVFSLFVTAIKIYRFAKKQRKQTFQLISISNRIHRDAEKLREDMVEDALDKLFQE